MSGPPSASPPNSTCRAATSGASVRQLLASVAWAAGGLRRRQVGVDVAAAEGVDRLLGVADQDHRGVPGERPLQDLPLHRVGVLEFVDQHDRPARPHPVAGRRIRPARARSASRLSRSS